MATKIHPVHGKVGTEFYDSVAAYADAAKATLSFGDHLERSWAGMTFNEAVEAAHKGWKDGISMLSEFDHGLLNPVDTNGVKWDGDVAGAYPVVPAYIAGDPMNMRRRKDNRNAKAPIRVFASIGYSASFSKDSIQTRGNIIASLVTTLSVSRPVELYVFSETAGCADSHKTDVENYWSPVVRIQTNPIDLGELSYALLSPAMLRQLKFNLGFNRGQSIGWAFGEHDLDAPKNIERWKKILEIGDDDILIPGMVSAYGDHPILKTPKKWMAEQLSRYGLTSTEA